MKKQSHWFIFFLFLSLPISQVSAQDPDLSSPFQTILTHFDNLDNRPRDLKKAAKALANSGYSQRELEDKALKLFRVFHGKGLWLSGEEMPRDPMFIDSISGKAEYHPFPEVPSIYLKKYGSDWKYSERTVRKIDILYEETFPFGEDRLLDWLPEESRYKFMGIEIWKIVAVFVLFALGFLIYKLITYLLNNWFIRALRKVPVLAKATDLLLRVARPLSFLIVLNLFRTTIPLLQFPVYINHILVILMNASVPLLLTIVGYRLVDLLSEYFQELSLKTESSLDDQLVPLLSKVLKTLVVIIGVVFVLVALEINVVPLLTGLSIGGLAFALAAQDTLKNFFGSVMIFLDKPFQIGHWIVAGDIDGEVEEVGFRSTRVRTFRNSVTYVPNGKIADTIIDNYGLRAYRRMNIKIGIAYDTPPELIEAFVEGLKKIVMEHPNTWKDKMEIHFNGMGSSALEILFYIFFNVPTWSKELEARHQVLLKIVELARVLGINFAFPTQTLHVENFPGKPSLSADYETNPEEIDKKLNSFFKEDKQ